MGGSGENEGVLPRSLETIFSHMGKTSRLIKIVLSKIIFKEETFIEETQ